MTQDSSLSSSVATVNGDNHEKRLPNGIHVVQTDNKSARNVSDVPSNKAVGTPWGYLFLQHFAAEKFEKKLETSKFEGDFKPRCFIHRTVKYQQKPSGTGVIKKKQPSVSGLVFLQGKTNDLRLFLLNNFPNYHLVNDCSTGKPASIKDSVMQPFMKVVKTEPERVTFLRDPFLKFAKDHVKLRVLTGLLTGMEGYVVRVLRDRQLVMDFGGNAVAISNVHNEDFEIVE